MSGKDIGLSDHEKAKLRYLIVQPKRFAIVALIMKKGKKYLAEISGELGIHRKGVSYHVRRLEKAGLVTTKLEKTPPDRDIPGRITGSLHPVYARYVYLTELAEKILKKHLFLEE